MKRSLLVLFAATFFLAGDFAAESAPGFEFFGMLGGPRDETNDGR